MRLRPRAVSSCPMQGAQQPIYSSRLVGTCARPCEQSRVKIRVDSSDGVYRGGLFKTDCYNAISCRMWPGRPHPDYTESLIDIAGKSNPCYDSSWFRLLIATVPHISGSSDGRDVFDATPFNIAAQRLTFLDCRPRASSVQIQRMYGARTGCAPGPGAVASCGTLSASGREPGMAAPYSQDLRDRVLAAYDRGMPTKAIAEVFAVSPAWARMVKQRRRDLGETAPRPMGGATVVKIDRARLAELVKQRPDATLKELRGMLGVQCAESAVCMALKKLGLSYKKRRSTPASRTAPTSPSAASSGGRSSPGSTRGG